MALELAAESAEALAAVEPSGGALALAAKRVEACPIPGHRP